MAATTIPKAPAATPSVASTNQIDQRASRVIHESWQDIALVTEGPTCWVYSHIWLEVARPMSGRALVAARDPSGPKRVRGGTARTNNPRGAVLSAQSLRLARVVLDAFIGF